MEESFDCNKSLNIPKGSSEVVNRIKTQRKGIKTLIIIYKTLYRNVQIEY